MQSTGLIVAEYIVGFAFAAAIIKFVLLPLIRKSDGSGGTGSGKPPSDGTDTRIP